MALRKPSLWLAFIHRSLIEFSIKMLSQTLLGIILITNAFAQQQQPPVKLPPTPNAASFLKYGETPVSTYTGTPDINIPIYTIDKGDFTLPITLRYHASGIKVGEEASWVGLGWNLDAGGVITYVDNFWYPFSYEANMVNSVSGVYDWTTGIADLSNDVLSSFRRMLDQNITPNFYSFSFCGYSGKFIENPIINSEYIFLSHNGIKLKVEKLGAEAINGFVITNEKGIKYYFDKGESTAGPIGTSERTSIHLTRISFPDLMPSDDIVFTYDQPGKVNNYDVVVERFYVNYTSSTGDGKYDEGTGINESYTSTGVYNTPLYLKEINSKNLKIKFTAQSRNDIEGVGAKRLESIDVYNNFASTPVKSFYFDNDYYFGAGKPLPFLSSRLKLNAFYEGKKTNPAVSPYKFSYNETVNLPSKNSFATDYWGYYNGITSNRSGMPNLWDWCTDNYLLQKLQADGSNRGSSAISMQANILTSIQYPTGGHTDFEYEPHNYSNYAYRSAEDIKAKGSTQALFQERADSPITLNTSIFSGSVVSDRKSFTVPSGQYFEIYIGYELWNPNQLEGGGPIGAGCSLAKLTGVDSDENGNSWNFAITEYTTGYRFFSGVVNGYKNCELSITLAKEACGNFDSNIIKGLNATVRIYEPRTIVLGKGPGVGAGLRVKSVSDYDQTNPNLKRSKIYSYINEEGKTSGKLMVPLNFLNYYSFDNVYNCYNTFEQHCYSTISRLKRYSYLASNSINYDGNLVGYNRVETIESGNGKIVDKYDNQVPVINNATDFSNFNVNYWGGNSNLISREFKSETGVLAIDKFEYNTVELSRHPYYVGSFARNVTNENPILQQYQYYYNIYKTPIISYQNVLTCKTHIENSNGNNLTTETSNVYDENTWQLTKKLFATSKGETIITSYTYPNNISTSPYNEMAKGYNMLGIVINEGTKVGGSQIEASNKVYRNTTSPPFLLDKIQKWKSSSLFTDEVVFDKYDDTNANVLQYTMKDGITTSLIYGYDKVYPIAEVKNAKSTDVAYTSFETQANVEGNWETSSNIRDVTVKVSGVQSYNMTNANVKCTGLDVAKQYVVSFWARSGTAKVNGADPIAGEAKNGWTYYELTVSNVSNVVVSGTSATSATAAVIDELRLCPVDATMRSFCYFPGVGVNSITDENSVTTFYQYDDLNRLKAIVDSEGNMLKSFEYNYQK